MGPFEWLATRWTPAIEYRDYPADEVEDIAWESTTLGSRRGFLVGFPVGVLFVVLTLAGVVLTGVFPPTAPSIAPGQAQKEAAALQVVRQEVNTLREENQALKQQVMETKAAATCPPCPPQAVAAVKPTVPAVAAPPPPSKHATTRAAARPKPRAPASSGQAAQPIPSNCRQYGDC